MMGRTSPHLNDAPKDIDCVRQYYYLYKQTFTLGGAS